MGIVTTEGMALNTKGRVCLFLFMKFHKCTYFTIRSLVRKLIKQFPIHLLVKNFRHPKFHLSSRMENQTWLDSNQVRRVLRLDSFFLSAFLFLKPANILIWFSINILIYNLCFFAPWVFRLYWSKNGIILDGIHKWRLTCGNI